MIMFAICLPESSRLVRLEDRLLYGARGKALLFESKEDALSYPEKNGATFHLDVFTVEEVEVTSRGVLICQPKEKDAYRMMIRRLSVKPEPKVLDAMVRMMPNDWRTEFVSFQSSADNLGASVRAILWAEGVSFQEVTEGRDGFVIIRVQRRKPDTRSEIAKRLSTPLPEYEDVGEWDCAGLSYNRGTLTNMGMRRGACPY